MEFRDYSAVWDICFQELCFAAAKDALSRKSSATRKLPLLAVAPVANPATIVSANRDKRLHNERCVGSGFGDGDDPRQQKIFRNLLLLRGPPDGGDLLDVPRSATVEVPLDEVYFTHDDVSDLFRDGRPLDDTIDELFNKKCDPFDSQFQLDVVRHEEKLWSLRNRRLYCLKQHQEKLRERALMRQMPPPSVKIRVYILSLEYGAVLAKFLDSFS